MYIIQLPVISTAHISPEADEWLREEGPSVLGDRCLSYEGGFFIYIGKENDKVEGDLPASVLAIFCWAEKNKHTWVRIDVDGDEISSLQKFEWRD